MIVSRGALTRTHGSVAVAVRNTATPQRKGDIQDGVEVPRSHERQRTDERIVRPRPKGEALSPR